MNIQNNEIDLGMAKKLLSSKGEFEINILSNSMSPLFKKGDRLKIIEVKEDLKRYDIIVFLRDGKFVVHYIWRINGVSKKSFITRSLENPHEDELPVQKSEVLGILKDVQLSMSKKIYLSLRYGI
ncbi:hypothetical protein BMS_3143 [Halobacteriovorax marinus SJ]|uniref:Peptidase S24/S26A/S26B/S26C domain-containing protein n=1 Tax=Halobacteriovorax marinus (strain ATCC BAA-682 / DSM 15412 / SJ) TaxID=862908 RepID=E1WZW4_HALMS|nr:S26 family signal peptidase [Halobacteriovorax marinus]CBW27900.1 hypothetical protein BMS_3143 [Halobacteriovorax marinus SJ]